MDKANLLLLVQEFRVAAEAEAAASGRARLLLSLAVAAGVGTIQNGYDIARLHQFVDWIGVMSYDLHGTFWPRRPYPPRPRRPYPSRVSGFLAPSTLPAPA